MSTEESLKLNEEEGDDGDNGPVPVIEIRLISVISSHRLYFVHQEEESTATFVPVVQLEKVEVKTFEEDEAIVYKQYCFLCLHHSFSNSNFRRGKLFLYGETMLDKGTGNKTWKERGAGDVKFLRFVFLWNCSDGRVIITI